MNDNEQFLGLTKSPLMLSVVCADGLKLVVERRYVSSHVPL